MMLVTHEAIQDAARRLRDVARLTPVIDVSEAACPLWLKCENMQPVGAFKIRGAYNFMAQLAEDVLRRSVVTYSSGNHGQAVASAARSLGASSVIVMPESAPAVKVAGARSFGAEVVFAGTTLLDRQARAEELAATRSLTIVPPFDHPHIIAGQGTVGLEILQQCPGVATVVVPAGGGGLVSGIAAAVKSLRPDVRLIAVEPEGAAKMTVSLAAGHPVTLDRTASMADGLLAVRPGTLTFEHVRALVDEVMTVNESEIAETTVWLAERCKLIVEPSGAVAAAAVRRRAREGRPLQSAVVAIVSGGNISLEALAKLRKSGT
ncbi:MAG: pyridoxal-phosphate dependent enzyme [Luteitalea sp.]|nr:pyridoxal-phosphate dependent enzyme [Luteitalea sp.]